MLNIFYFCHTKQKQVLQSFFFDTMETNLARFQKLQKLCDSILSIVLLIQKGAKYPGQRQEILERKPAWILDTKGMFYVRRINHLSRENLATKSVFKKYLVYVSVMQFICFQTFYADFIPFPWIYKVVFKNVMTYLKNKSFTNFWIKTCSM